MDFVDLVRAVAALALTLGLVALAAVVGRKYGPEALARFTTAKGPKRLAVVESLVLDPSRRLVLVRVDDREQLLLLGDGRLLSDGERRS